jgi:hypothetical protein
MPRAVAVRSIPRSGHVEMHQPAPPVGQHHDHEQHAKGRGGHRGKIQCDEILGMIVQKRAPRLRRPRPEAKHVLRHRRLRYGEAELQQFAVDSWCAPERFGAAHPPNQISQLRTNQGPRGPSATLPRPVASETQAVPPHYGLGLHQPQRTPPARPEPRQHDPENSVHRPQLWPRLARFPHRELLPKCKVLQRQLAVRANRAPQCPPRGSRAIGP